VQKLDALAGIFHLAVHARDDKAIWGEHVDAESDRPAGRPFWRELETRKVGSKVVRSYALCVPLLPRPPRPPRHIVIELKLTVGGLTLRLRTIPNDAKHRKRRRTGRGSIDQYRKHRKGLRRLHRRLEEPFSTVPLVSDDDQLRALVALRCMQQEYHAEAALEVLRGYAGMLRVPAHILDDVLSRVVCNFVSGPPGGLPAYIRNMKRVVLAEEADADAERRNRPKDSHEAQEGDVPDESPLRRRRSSEHVNLYRGEKLFSVSETAHKLRVSRRTVYDWIKRGVLSPAKKKEPLRIAQQELERARELSVAKPRTFYRIVMRERGCTFEAARKWVGRRRAKGLSDRDILVPAGAGRSPTPRVSGIFLGDEARRRSP
jgi:hypothetical protein